MILANWPRRASEEPHSSTALDRLVEALFLPWSVSMSSDAPSWRPPSRARSVWSFSRNDGLEARFRIAEDPLTGDLAPKYYGVREVLPRCLALARLLTTVVIACRGRIGSVVIHSPRIRQHGLLLATRFPGRSEATRKSGQRSA